MSLFTIGQQYVTCLQRSFAATYALLDRPKSGCRIVVVLLAIHTVLLAYSAYVHSPTLNEPGHLVAGLSYWKFDRFDVYNVNPPLVKMVAALPVIAAGYEEDWSGFYTGSGARPEFAMGEDFVAANGERSFFLFMVARWACIPFSWLGGVICYLWARDLYGRPAGVIACAIWSFEPNILAHSALITSDAAGAALGVAACYTFWRWLKRPTWLQAALTGTVLGLAELTKTTLILFYPIWPLLWLVYRWTNAAEMTARAWLREAGMLALRMAIGLYVVNLGYAFEGSLTPLKEFHFVSELFTGQSQENQQPVNRFVNSWFGEWPVPFPKNYLLGIDIQQKDFEHYDHPSFLRGEWRNRGWWYYYLYATLIKIPLSLWGLGLIALTMSIFRDRSASATRRPPSGFDTLILLVPPLVLFCVVSSKTGFSEHFRYVLPVFPFMFIWLAGAIRWAILRVNQNYVDKPTRYALIVSRATSIAALPQRLLIFAILLLWFATSSLWIYPHSLSYFSEAIGGPLNGAEYLSGSSVDWGQDLRYLIWSLSEAERNALPDSRRLAFTALYNPSDLGFPPCRRVPDEYSDAMATDRGKFENENGVALTRLPEGVYWVSVSFEHGMRSSIRPNSSDDGSVQRESIEKSLLYAKEVAYSIKKAVVE